MRPLLRSLQTVVATVLIAVCGGCADMPAPPEVALATRQEQDLRGAGALRYAPEEFRLYLDELATAQSRMQEQQQRLPFLRDAEGVSAAFRQVLNHGAQLEEKIGFSRRVEYDDLHRRRQTLQKNLTVLRNLSTGIKDRRLASRRLVQIDIRLGEALRLIDAGKADEARQRLAEAATDLRAAVTALRPLLERFNDRSQISTWRSWRDEALAASQKSGGHLIVISKIERQLTLYRGGKVQAQVAAGFGGNLLSDKLHAGDKATPEGSYRVQRKIPNSTYFKALLIDYPNNDDRRRFRAAQRSGALAAATGIGGLIEIHGGGSDGLTDGCVALDNRDMERLYAQIAIGTPVLIVGTTDYDNLVSSAFRQFE